MQSPDDADPRTTNSRGASPPYVNYTTDPSTSTEGHSSDTGSRTGSLTAWLRQQCVNRHTSLSYLTRRLQSVLNAAARLIYQLRSSDHITDALVCLHWLRISEHIAYKIALLTYRVTNGMVPWYLEPFVRVADLPGRRALRFTLTNRLTVPAVKLSTVGSRAFSSSSPQTYRKKSPLRHLCLPSNVTSRHSYLKKIIPGHYCRLTL